MAKRSLLGLAIAIVAEAFKDKIDNGGQPYILHCLYVMNKTQGDEERKIIAVLHDLLEDCSPEWSADRLASLGFSIRIITALDLLTHKKGEDYLDVYIKKIATNPDAREVKLRDLEHNSMITRLKGLREKDIDRLVKYQRAYVYLRN